MIGGLTTHASCAHACNAPAEGKQRHGLTTARTAALVCHHGEPVLAHELALRHATRLETLHARGRQRKHGHQTPAEVVVCPECPD